MARFAARFGNYSHGCRNGRWMVLEDGQSQELTKELYATFRQGLLTESEIQYAIKNMVHRGLAIDRNTEEHFSPRHRISGFDSELAQIENDWTDEEREIVEQKLRDSQHAGSDHIELLPEPAMIPWANYNEIQDPDVILQIAKAVGTSFEDVLAYERENANRPEVIEALTAASHLAPDPGFVIQA